MNENSFDIELINSNLLGAKTLSELYEKEKIATHTKMIALKNRPIEGSLDYVHLKAIHYFLFSDVYSWAGKDRFEVDIKAKFGKGKTVFTPFEKIPDVSKALFDALKEEEFFQGQSKVEFAKSSAIFMNGLNILHPFREGNGRVQRIFMEYLAKNAGYILSFHDIESKDMVLASIRGASGDLKLMGSIFFKSLKI